VQLKNAQAFQARVHELETVNIVALTRERDEARKRIAELKAETRRLFAAKEDAMRMYEEAVSETQQATIFLKAIFDAEEDIDIDSEWLSKVGEFVAHVSNMQFLPCCKSCGVPTPRRYMRGDACMPCRMKVDGDDRRDTNADVNTMSRLNGRQMTIIADLRRQIDTLTAQRDEARNNERTLWERQVPLNVSLAAAQKERDILQHCYNKDEIRIEFLLSEIERLQSGRDQSPVRELGDWWFQVDCLAGRT
jgi:hypothetical protein